VASSGAAGILSSRGETEMPEITKTRTTTTTYKITHVIVDFCAFNNAWRRIRGNMRYKGFDCFLCHKKFEDGERMGLMFTIKGNKVVCQKCGTEIEKQLAEENAPEVAEPTP
jgi:hypothetical protein